MTSDVSGRRRGTCCILALAAATLLAWPLAGAWQYDRDRVAAGELWRLSTCQWTHWSVDHLIWDAFVFVALGLAAARRGLAGTLMTVVLAAVLVPAAVHVFCPAIATFRGLSGIDSALFGLIVARLGLGGRRSDRVIAGVALAGFAAKIGCEAATGAAVFAYSGATYAVVPLAHGVGCAVGALVPLGGRFLCGDIRPRPRKAFGERSGVTGRASRTAFRFVRREREVASGKMGDLLTRPKRKRCAIFGATGSRKDFS